ncbi:alpha/beta hydrolase [Terrimonas sp. NA20]|uniref:Alpha/beta hydrolase n=1 Tax=Terrimonas ginsenosidimutans TaxID=2908004 RepID=A0ABS9KLF7_9BACT|nr:alpha/beta hydrolase [Terrimonas ginsenosidimutans]MCG2613145.1 alpha/beta hydrolase [Terrimonas ginsenosidimutans]
MYHRLLTYKASFISYYRFGNGPVPVLCFHGYGENASSFSFLEHIPDRRYSFHAIELPFHGNTAWRDGLRFTAGDLDAIIKLIGLPPDTKPVLIGYSLGGRIALSLYQRSPECYSKLILLAPDGLLMNPWYWFATQTLPGNRLFRLTMHHPGWFFSLLKLMNKTGQVNASVFKFVNAYIGNRELRLVLYDRWTILRKLKPDLKTIRTLIRQHQTRVKLIYGKYDRIILPERGEKFRKGIEEYCSIKVLNGGHQILQEKFIADIIEALELP